jgi:DNA-binding NarL/FixJ family response regulator
MRLLEAIEVLKMSQFMLNDELSEAIDVVVNAYEEKNPAFSLTMMQQVVLDSFKTGLRKNKIIARELKITPRAVKIHLTAIYKKYGVKSRYELYDVVNK